MKVPDEVIKEIQISTVETIFKLINKNPKITEKELIEQINNSFKRRKDI